MDYVPFTPSASVAPRAAPAAVRGERDPPWTTSAETTGTFAHLSDGFSGAQNEQVTEKKQNSGNLSRFATLATAAFAQLDSFHERASIAEFDGGLPRAHAEVLAALSTLDLGPEAAGILNIVAKRLEFLAQAGEIS